MKLEEGAVTTRQVATVTISKAGDQRVILACLAIHYEDAQATLKRTRTKHQNQGLTWQKIKQANDRN